ncbi:tyrosine-type recombinase/integrase [Nocardia thailandica]
MTVISDDGSPASQVVPAADVQNLLLSGLAGPTLRAFATAIQNSPLASNTQQTYIERVHDFLRCLDLSAHPSALTTSTGLNRAADAYISVLRSRGVADSTINVSLAALDALGVWLELGPVDAPRASLDQIVPRTLDQRQHSALLSAAAARPLRDYALISLLLDAGPRPSEVTALDIDDVVLDPGAGRGSVRLTSLSGAVRTVPLGGGCVAVLNVLLVERRTALRGGRGGAALFVGSTRPTRLSERSVDRIVREVGRAATPTIEISPSTLRNTCEARLLAAGRHPVAVAALMGQQEPDNARVQALAPTPQMALDLGF